MLNTIERDLEKWGRWVRSGLGARFVSSPALMMMDLKHGATGAQVSISDDDALRIDNAVAQLKSVNEITGDAVSIYFVRNYDYIKLSAKLGCGREKARILVQSGVHWIDGYLSSMEKNH